MALGFAPSLERKIFLKVCMFISYWLLSFKNVLIFKLPGIFVYDVL